MNSHLSPTYTQQFDNHYLLWFKASNTYTVVDDSFMALLNLYFEAENEIELKNHLKNINSELSIEDTLNSVTRYLEDCNIPLKTETHNTHVLDHTKQNITHCINVFGKTLQLNFDSEIVEKTIFPALYHLECNNIETPDSVFTFYLKEGYLYCYENEEFIICVPKLDYHLLQGKFIFKLLCTIHNKKESDWVGTFHGCTITNNKTSIFITGVSGKGKSTLSALLASSGLGMLADDVSPLLAEDLNIYQNPAAVSLKSGSFNIIESYIEDFNNIPEIQFNPHKGGIKYVPFKNTLEKNYPCNAIVLVNYKKNAETKLEKVDLPEVLNAFISDSWVSEKPEHAKLFIKWLKRLEFYKLTYSNNSEGIKTINCIF